MKRKINQVGTGTLTISLPARWVENQKLKKGDELDVRFNPREIVFSVSGHKHEPRDFSMGIDHLNRYLLARYLELLYISNYDKIVFTYSKTELYDDKTNQHTNLKSFLNRLKNRFIGMEIVSQTATSTEFKVFIINKEETLEQIEKRIYFLLKESFSELIESINHRHKDFHQSIYEHHDNISKFIYYLLRVLGESDKSEDEKRLLYALYIIVDKLVDEFRHISEMIDRHGCTEKVKKYLKEIFLLIDEQFMTLHRREIDSELVTRRYRLVQRIDRESFNVAEMQILSEVKVFLDTINDFSRAAIVGKLNRRE